MSYTDLIDGETQISAEEWIAAQIYDHPAVSINEGDAGDLGRRILAQILTRFCPDLVADDKWQFGDGPLENWSEGTTAETPDKEPKCPECDQTDWEKDDGVVICHVCGYSPEEHICDVCELPFTLENLPTKRTSEDCDVEVHEACFDEHNQHCAFCPIGA